MRLAMMTGGLMIAFVIGATAPTTARGDPCGGRATYPNKCTEAHKQSHLNDMIKCVKKRKEELEKYRQLSSLASNRGDAIKAMEYREHMKDGYQAYCDKQLHPHLDLDYKRGWQ